MKIHRVKRRWTPRPGTPEDFLRFFTLEYQDKLSRVHIPGMEDASWDRKAAWLLWRITHGKEA